MYLLVVEQYGSDAAPLGCLYTKTTIPQIFKDFEIFPIDVHLRPLEEPGIYALMEHAQCIT